MVCMPELFEDIVAAERAAEELEPLVCNLIVTNSATERK